MQKDLADYNDKLKQATEERNAGRKAQYLQQAEESKARLQKSREDYRLNELKATGKIVDE